MEWGRRKREMSFVSNSGVERGKSIGLTSSITQAFPGSEKPN